MNPRPPAGHPRYPHSSDGGNRGWVGEERERVWRYFASCFAGTQSGHSDMAPPSRPRTLYYQQMPNSPEMADNPPEPDHRCQCQEPQHVTQKRYHTNMLATTPTTNSGHHPHPPPGLGQQARTMPQEAGPGGEIIIALMGVTGAGKSYFIREVSGNSEVVVSSDLYSCTREVQSYSFEYQGAKITLVDTPGFDDADRSDTKVLREIADWASATYGEKRLLSGIIYLHPITHSRMEGSSLRNLRMFQSLCGQKFPKNVFLTTTQWSSVDPAVGKVRENSLWNDDFWDGLIDKGATLRRFYGTRESGLELIRGLMTNYREHLDIQVQIVNQRVTLPGTGAGKCVIGAPEEGNAGADEEPKEML